MKVVADTSPLISLNAIGRLDLLKGLFGQIAIPSGVKKELEAGERGFALQDWFKVLDVKDYDVIKILNMGIGLGESEAITLYFEEKYDLIILDDKGARKIAANLGMEVIGTIGILLEAKKKNLIKSLKQEIDKLELKTDFRISKDIIERVLKIAGELKE